MKQFLFQTLLSPSRAEDNDDGDVTIGKRLLRMLGYGRRSTAGPSCFAGKDFFDDIRAFQKDNGLKVDGVITPTGETARTLEQQLNEKINVYSDDDELETWEDIDDSWGESEHEKRCAFQMLKYDKPACQRLERQRRRQGRYKNRPHGQAAAECYASMNERYAHCMAGKPLKDLPPLNIWDH